MRRHDFDLFPFVAGVVFLILALAYGLDAFGVWQADDSWLLGLGLAALGAAGLASAVLARRKR
ncbi:hypothetical protein BIV57_18360 [Mangrovactinospora gilvigrisea]|uniref:Uncharacterized protein n=1 Tax=Mangrovactinospora gilvigrisea TaxID=1428644 RepID=A0A1J7BBM8_9ACTN|nr:hypothetical protein [Mangrovactinospora gilvigrisea]OIV36051.1 hypothetical protein BIV57_18360 [Mangrovactinospora gilvigrisea]